jgi:tetratricopeptide (TPR) repeat protein
MPATDRLTQLEALARESPDDPFVCYGLALEYRAAGRLDDALRTFDALLAHDPDYVPTYYQLGVLLAARGDVVRAREVLERGVEVATAAGESHTVRELYAAIEDFT